jgi:polyhydroxyalkanoate synthase
MTNVDVDKIQREMQEFSQRFARGIGALADVGSVTLGSAPKEQIYSQDKLVLYRYSPSETAVRKDRVRVPMLICYALVNRPYQDGATRKP